MCAYVIRNLTNLTTNKPPHILHQLRQGWLVQADLYRLNHSLQLYEYPVDFPAANCQLDHSVRAWSASKQDVSISERTTCYICSNDLTIFLWCLCLYWSLQGCFASRQVCDQTGSDQEHGTDDKVSILWLRTHCLRKKKHSTYTYVSYTYIHKYTSRLINVSIFFSFFNVQLWCSVCRKRLQVE